MLACADVPAHLILDHALFFSCGKIMMPIGVHEPNWLRNYARYSKYLQEVEGLTTQVAMNIRINSVLLRYNLASALTHIRWCNPMKGTITPGIHDHVKRAGLISLNPKVPIGIEGSNSWIIDTFDLFGTRLALVRTNINFNCSAA